MTAVANAARPPLVSVVVPVFNGERYLRESLDSILAQTYTELEVLVMDDASEDATPEIVASYGDRVRHVRQERTHGIYGNANGGIALARGEYVAVYHADDVYLPELVERQVAWLEAHRGAGAVFCCDVFVDPDGREFGRLELPREVRGERPLDYAAVLNALLIHQNTFLRPPTVLARASAYREAGPYRDDRWKNTAEIELYLRIARRHTIGILEDHLLRYRKGHGSSSERYHRIRTEPFRFFRILEEELEQGGHKVATPEAVRAFEAHRAVDRVLCAVNSYVVGDRSRALTLLRETSLLQLVRSGRVQRWRMLVLALGLHALVRLPRSAVLAGLFERHWHGTPAAGRL